MTQEPASTPYLTVTSAPKPKGTGKKQINLEEIAESFQIVAEDIREIGKLTSQERNVVTQFLESLHRMPTVTSTIAVSTIIIPIEFGVVAQAHIQPTGHLDLKLADGRHTLVDLSEPNNRDLMLAVINDVLPKIEALAQEIASERLHKTTIQEPPHIETPALQPRAPAFITPEPLLTPTIAAEPPVNLPEPEPALIEQPLMVEPEQDLLAERDAKIEAITTETLNYLEMLGGEVFEQAPVSRYFDDWMVNLRQIILSFESSEVIGPDEVFIQEYNQIFGNIEDELAKRISSEAEIEVSARTLVENRYLLNKIDEGYAAKTKELVVKGKSALDNLMRNMQSIEKELAEVQQTKTSYRHPLQKMAKDQKVAELTQKLNAVKKRLAVAVGTSSVNSAKHGDIDAEYEAQSKELEEKRRLAMDFLSKNVADLEVQIDRIKKTRTNNPVKRVANQQQIYEFTEKLIDAKKRLQLAEQNSSAEMQLLREEYEKKKQATLGKVQSLEKDIATKAVDNSTEVRKEAAKALAEAVKALSQRKVAAPLSPAVEAPS